MLRPILYEQGTQEWLNWRLNGITATEASAAFGVSKWATPLSVYNDKLNPQPHEPSKYEEWGTRLENVIKFEKFAKEHPEFEVRQGGCYEDDWRKCSLDGELWQNNMLMAILEIKTGRDASAWDPIPEYYKAQVMWQMHVTGIHKAYFAVLINGCDYFERTLEYDPHYCEELEKACLELWKCICEKRPPAATKANIDQPIVNAMVAETEAKSNLELDDDLVKEYFVAKEEFGKWDEAFKKVKLKLSEKFRDAKRLTYRGSTIGSFVQMAGRSTVDVKLLKSKYPEIYKEVMKTGAPVSYPKFF